MSPKLVRNGAVIVAGGTSSQVTSTETTVSKAWRGSQAASARPGMKIDAAPIASAEAPPKYNARDLPVIVPLPTTFTRISKLRMTRGPSAIPPLQSPGKANELGVNLKIPSRDCGGYSSRRRPVCEVKRIQNAPACCFLNGQDFPEKDNSLKIKQKSMRPDLEPKNSWHRVGAIRGCCIKITRELV